MNKDNEEYPGVRKETHYTIVEEPGGEYLTHLTPEGGKGQDIANAILTWLEESSQLEGLKILGADSTAVNTGPKNGALHLIEEGLGRKAQWNICKLHINELGLRHLIADIDGPTNSENTFSGPIVKIIKTNVEDIEINQKFKKIITGEDIFDLPNEVVDDLSTDQKYRYMMVKMIRSGVIDKSVTKLKCGPICHSH